MGCTNCGSAETSWSDEHLQRRREGCSPEGTEAAAMPRASQKSAVAVLAWRKSLQTCLLLKHVSRCCCCWGLCNAQTTATRQEHPGRSGSNPGPIGHSCSSWDFPATPKAATAEAAKGLLREPARTGRTRRGAWRPWLSVLLPPGGEATHPRHGGFPLRDSQVALVA